MLASDSDSELEYPAEAHDSDASSDCALQGKLALGIDPQEMKTYDGRSTPTNGSQYLMRVMKEKKTTPKVAFTDVSRLPVRKSEVDCENLSPAAGGSLCSSEKNYLENFLQRCSAYERENIDEPSSSVLPLSKWREEVISNFSMIRSRVECWQHRMESQELRIEYAPKLPQNNDNIHWLRFCYGQSFIQLAASTKKTNTPEQKLQNFFLDLYQESTSEKILSDLKTSVNASENQPAPPPAEEKTKERENEGGGGDTGARTTAESGSSTSSNDSAVEVEPEEPPARIEMGHRPVMSILMRLTHSQLENLIKWNLLWLNNIGFINECQGQWIYSLLACIPKPVDPNVVSDMRDIARALIKARRSDCWISMLEDDQCADEKLFDFVNSLNLLVYVIADYFDQKDLVTKL